MDKLIQLRADAASVWRALTNPELTVKFFFGCGACSDWKVGSDLLFKVEHEGLELEPLRRGVNERQKVRFDYTDVTRRVTTRTVRPMCMTFWGKTWLVTACCELRRDFGRFRADRMGAVELLEEAFEDEDAKDLEAFMRRVREGDSGS